MKKFGSAIILAGGKSSRMGFDKQLIKLNERRLMDSLIHKLKGEFEDIIIVTNRPELYIGLSHKITEDILLDKGPLGGIHAGLLQSSSEYSFVVACDMPNISLDYIRYMKKHISDNALGCVTKFGDWIEPFGSFYSIELIDSIEDYLITGRRSVNGLLEDKDITYIEENAARKFSPNWDMFLNLNTKEELDNYLGKLSNEWGS
jgi:molybdopterin-guanine dinucleotide biosynthesis protein A